MNARIGNAPSKVEQVRDKARFHPALFGYGAAAALSAAIWTAVILVVV